MHLWLKINQDEIRFTSLLKKYLKKLSMPKNYEKYFKKDLVMTKEKEENIQMANKFHICVQLFEINALWTRDYCYMTGKYWVYPRQSCNINYRVINKMPLVFDNLKRDDGHHIM